MINKLYFKKNIYLILFVFAFSIRLIIAFYSYRLNVWNNFADDQQREIFAQSILNHGFTPSFENTSPIEYIIAPFVPIIIAVKILIFGKTWLPLFLLNSIIGAISCFLIYRVALLLFNKPVAYASFVWAAIYPNFLRYTATAGNEPWIVFFFIVTVYLLLKLVSQSKNGWELVLFATSYTLLFHTDERYIIYAPVFALFLFLTNQSLLKKIKAITIFTTLVIVLSVPWLIRNYMVLDEIIVVSTRTASITNPIFNHRKDIIFNHLPSTSVLTCQQVDSVIQGKKITFDDGRPIPYRQVEAMKHGIIPRQFNKLESFFSRVYFLWLPFKFKPSYRIDGFNFVNEWSLKHNLSSILTFGAFIPFMILGLVFLAKQRKWAIFIVFSTIIIFHTLIHALFIPYTRDRYRHPIDFIITILAFYSIFIIYNFIKHFRTKSL